MAGETVEDLRAEMWLAHERWLRAMHRYVRTLRRLRRAEKRLAEEERA